jgi:hypothetical protein
MGSKKVLQKDLSMVLPMASKSQHRETHHEWGAMKAPQKALK